MEKLNQKKMYILFVLVIVVLLFAAAFAGAGIAVHINNRDKEDVSEPEQNIGSLVDPSQGVLETPSSQFEEPGISSLDQFAESSDVPAVDTVTDPVETVGPYAVGAYYVGKSDGKNLKLRASASTDVDTGVEIPAKAKLEITQIIASADPSYPYWGATTYAGTQGYVAMQFLTDAATYEAENGPGTNNVGEYTSGMYVVATGGTSGIKVKDAPGNGNGLSVLANGTEVLVMDIQKWDAAKTEDTVYWGHIEWKGWDAYIPMYYMQPIVD